LLIIPLWLISPSIVLLRSPRTSTVPNWSISIEPKLVRAPGVGPILVNPSSTEIVPSLLKESFMLKKIAEISPRFVRVAPTL